MQGSARLFQEAGQPLRGAPTVRTVPTSDYRGVGKFYSMFNLGLQERLLSYVMHPLKANMMYRCHFTREGPIVGGENLEAATLEGAIEEARAMRI